MPKLSDEFISEVLAKTNIIDVIGEKVTLSKKGKSYFGLCPFHNEKTASFSVEPERKIYNCFSCGEKGNAVTFLQKTNNYSFLEAIEDLAQRANVEMDFSEFKTEKPHQNLYEINDAAMKLYNLFLSNTKSGIDAKTYLLNRGISLDVMKKFEIGLAPDQFDLLHKTLTNQGYIVSDLHDLGLVKRSQNDRFYDLFRNRIIFPIKDGHGNVVAFSGRTYKDDDESAKYINSPQTKVFTKSQVLYNLHNAVNEIKKTDRVLLFEGYMDVIAAYRAGLKEAVASMGTSLTTEQISSIKKYTQNVYICYDGDPAGIEATSRAIKMFEREKMNVKVVLLPDRLDPDDYIQKYGEQQLRDFIDTKWIDALEFIYKKQNMDIDFTKMLDIEHFKKTIFEMIKNASNTVIESYINRLALDTKLSQESIRQDFNQYTKRNIQNLQYKRQQTYTINSKYQIAERRLLLYFLEDKKYLFNYHKEFGEVFHIDENVRQLKDAIEDIYLDNDLKDLDTVKIYNSFIEKLSEAQKLFFEENCTNKHLKILQQEYVDLIAAMNDYQFELLIEHTEEQMKNAPTVQEKIRLAEFRDLKIKEEKYGQR